jgi:hypothetical protein
MILLPLPGHNVIDGRVEDVFEAPSVPWQREQIVPVLEHEHEGELLFRYEELRGQVRLRRRIIREVGPDRVVLGARLARLEDPRRLAPDPVEPFLVREMVHV